MGKILVTRWRLLPLLVFCCLSHAVSGQRASVQTAPPEDTVNVERYDDQKLKPLVGTLMAIPFFNAEGTGFWYAWNEAGEDHQCHDFLLGKGKDTISFERTKAFEHKTYPRIKPYGTSPDSLFRFSEDACHNLFLEDLRTHQKRQLTTDGAPDYTFDLYDLQWLQGGKCVIMRKDGRGVRKLAVLSSLHLPPMAVNYTYELPGDTVIEKQEIYLADLNTGAFRKLPVDRWKYQTVALQKAEGVTDACFFWRKKRTRDLYDLIRIDTAGTVRSIIEQKSVPRINSDMFACTIANKGNDIFVWTDRTGWGHYDHYDRNGKWLNAVTKGNWTCGRILKVDELHRHLYLLAYGREAGVNPNFTMAYRVNFNGKDLRLLTPENANHNVFVGPNCRLLVDTYSRIDMAPTVAVRNGGGKLIQIIEKVDISRLLDYGWKYPETFKVKAADGLTDLYGIMWKPYDFDPGRKYPIISQVYPGPFTETVWNDFTVFDRYHNAALAQRGFIVVVFGHRGSSPYRSKNYYVYGHGNLRDYPLADDRAGLEQLGRRYPFIDLSRVGIVGHSGGAMMAAAALMTYPDFYKAAVASSGNYDNRIYNRNWGEQYQGIGEDNKFSVKTVQELAPRLKGHLMLVTGDRDQNVHPAQTQRLVEALIQANKDFELLVLPGQEHHYDFKHQMYFERKKRDFFSKYLK